MTTARTNCVEHKAIVVSWGGFTPAADSILTGYCLSFMGQFCSHDCFSWTESFMNDGRNLPKSSFKVHIPANLHPKALLPLSISGGNFNCATLFFTVQLRSIKLHPKEKAGNILSMRFCYLIFHSKSMRFFVSQTIKIIVSKEDPVLLAPLNGALLTTISVQFDFRNRRRQWA